MKKMRKLLPAFAMLLVSAIMMSTASFAWFTMNESVTATGMQVQAKASGNLLISKEKMTAADSKVSVDLSSNKKELTAITYNKTAKEWQEPKTGLEIDPTYGTYTPAEGALVKVTTGLTYGESKYFSDYTIYLATAGDAAEMQAKTLYVSISGLVADQNIAPAYTIAFYVDQNGDDVIDYDADLFGTVNYEAFTNFNGDAVAEVAIAGPESDKKVNIPSTYGATADNKVGLKVVMRVYVDGDLNAEAQSVSVKDIKKATGKWTAAMAGYTFYTDEKGENVVNSAMFDTTTDISSYYYWDGQDTSYKNVDVPTKYVNNAWVPTGASTFSVTIAAK